MVTFGIQEIVSEMSRQVYVDGYCHEASTNYHRLVTEIFLSTSILIERIPSREGKSYYGSKLKVEKKPKLQKLCQKNINLQAAGRILPTDFTRVYDRW